MRYPSPEDELPTLDSYAKPHRRGLIQTVVAFVVWCASKLWLAPRTWAKSYLEDYYTTLANGRGGFDVLRPLGSNSVSASLWLHEGVHGWQAFHAVCGPDWWAKTIHSLDYLLRPRRGRLRRIEAQAYAAEVLAGFRTIAQASKNLVGRTYYPEPWYTPTLEEGREAIEEALEGWKVAGFDRDSIRKLGDIAIGEVYKN